MKYIFLISAAAAMVACSEDQGTLDRGAGGIVAPAVPAMRTMTGIVEADAGGVALRVGEASYPLAGADEALRNVAGAEVEVRGSDDDVTAFIVQSFMVLRVDGEPADDGILRLHTDGYRLELQSGADRAIVDPPEELQQLVGRRVWITGPADARPDKFGLIL